MNQVRVSVYALALALSVTFSACSEKKQASATETTTTTESVATDTKPAETASASTGSSDVDNALDEYEKSVGEYKGVMDRVKKGEVGAIQEIQTLTIKIQTIIARVQNQDGTLKLTPEQEARSKNISEKYAAAVQ